ncbi:hypothetical protein G9A89_022819 [Geosiphon pyriformis]|nr:hypothetical protein G9A89_022819 [Geosiphon pyriformis]
MSSLNSTPTWPSLDWPPFRDRGISLEAKEDIWRFTVFWTLLFFASIYGTAGIWAWIVFHRWRWSFLIPVGFIAVSLLTGLVGGTIVGYVLGALYNSGSFILSTWVPCLWGLTQALVAVMGSRRSAMTKKNKGKNLQCRVDHRELFQRMNFLYQAAALMTTTILPEQNNQINSKNKSGSESNNQFASPQNIAPLGRFYINTMKNIGKKQVLRMDPSIKRTLCNRCETLLVPGFTSRIRVKSRKQKHLEVMCTECLSTKSFPVREGYQIFSEKSENIASVDIPEPHEESEI